MQRLKSKREAGVGCFGGFPVETGIKYDFRFAIWGDVLIICQGGDSYQKLPLGPATNMGILLTTECPSWNCTFQDRAFYWPVVSLVPLSDEFKSRLCHLISIALTQPHFWSRDQHKLRKLDSFLFPVPIHPNK